MADSRYVIDILLKARDDTARAFASAIGNAEAYERITKEQARTTANQRGELDRLAASTQKVDASERQLAGTRKALSTVSADATKKQVEYENAVRNYVKTNANANASDAQRKLALDNLAASEKSFSDALK